MYATQRELSSTMSVSKDHRSDSIRKALQRRGISTSIADLIVSSWREGTRKQYGYAWKKWFVWNTLRFGNPFQTSEVIVIQFLHYLVQIQRSYSVINSHKAMLLQTLPFFGNNWCKECTLINRFMKGVFFQSPPKPRYLFTWDVSCVLRFLSSLFPLDGLSMRLLTFKVTALIALATAPRAQTLVSMDLDHMLLEQSSVTFCFPKLLKTSRVGHSFSLCIDHFQDESLCAMHTLLHYINVTRSLRQSRSVLISYVTFKAVTTSTIARWLKTVLDLSGINTNTFKAHSYRAASMSAAFSKGCSLERILKAADWSSDKNFRKFYCRHSVRKDQVSFTNAVFQV